MLRIIELFGRKCQGRNGAGNGNGNGELQWRTTGMAYRARSGVSAAGKGLHPSIGWQPVCDNRISEGGLESDRECAGSWELWFVFSSWIAGVAGELSERPGQRNGGPKKGASTKVCPTYRGRAFAYCVDPGAASVPFESVVTYQAAARVFKSAIERIWNLWVAIVTGVLLWLAVVEAGGFGFEGSFRLRIAFPIWRARAAPFIWQVAYGFAGFESFVRSGWTRNTLPVWTAFASVTYFSLSDESFEWRLLAAWFNGDAVEASGW